MTSMPTPVEHPSPDRAVDISVVRRLTLVTARIAARDGLEQILQEIADGIVESLEFGAAAVNHRLPNGDFKVLGVAGGSEVRETLADTIVPGAAMQELLDLADQWGQLHHVPHDRVTPDLIDWIPETSPDSEWHPLDMLFAPLTDTSGRLVGILSVDLPPGGRRPSQVLCELLELFAMQAGIAIATSELRERYEQERSSRERTFRSQAETDALTGLANRRLLERELNEAIIDARFHGGLSAILFCDVNELKPINDRFGHEAGDQAIRAWGQALVERTRGGDLVARTGGDEFVVIARRITPETADRLAQRFRQPLDGEGPAAGMTISVGWVYVDPDLDAASLLALADQAMYAEKQKRLARQRDRASRTA